MEIKPIFPSDVEQQKIIDVSILTNKVCFLLSGFPTSLNQQKGYLGLMVVKPDGSYFHTDFKAVLESLGDKKLAFISAVKFANAYPLKNQFFNISELMVIANLEALSINQYTHNKEVNKP